jgi:hypothetical protein
VLEQFPFTDGVYSWWPIIQVIPRKGATLVGIAYVVPISIIGFYQGTVCLIGRVNTWGIFRPMAFLQAMVDEFALEVQAEVYGADPGDTLSEVGDSTAAPSTVLGGIWQAPSSSGGTWFSSASSSASSSTGGSTGVSISWNVIPGLQMDPVPEVEEEVRAPGAASGGDA